MSPKKAQHQVKVYMTNQQHEALKRALEASGKSQSEFIRDAVEVACKQHSVTLPRDMPKRGTYLRKGDYAECVNCGNDTRHRLDSGYALCDTCEDDISKGWD